MKWIVIILTIGNCFFIHQTYFWQKQAIDQMIVTYDVENLFSKLEYEIKYDQIVELTTESPGYAYEYDLSKDKHSVYSKKDGYDAFEIGGGHTLAIVKDGTYVGSRLKEVPDLGPWLVRAINF